MRQYLVETILTLALANSSIGIEWDDFNSGAAGALKTSDGAVFLMNPKEIPEFTGELPPEVICRCISLRSVHKPVGLLPHSKPLALALGRTSRSLHVICNKNGVAITQSACVSDHRQDEACGPSGTADGQVWHYFHGARKRAGPNAWF